MPKQKPTFPLVALVVTSPIMVGGKHVVKGVRVEVRKNVAIELMGRGAAKLADDSKAPDLGKAVDGKPVKGVSRKSGIQTEGPADDEVGSAEE